MVPQFLQSSFEMLRESQEKVMESMGGSGMKVPGLEAIQAQQEAFLKAMTGGISLGTPQAPAQRPKPKRRKTGTILMTSRSNSPSYSRS